MNKSLFILEGRRRKYKTRYVPNSVDHVIGIFTSVKKAEEWIDTEGKLFYPKHLKSSKDLFWALVEVTDLNECSGYLYGFYELS